MEFSIDEAKKLLGAAGVFFDADDLKEDPETFNRYVLNMNDVWGWACAYCEGVQEDELPELALLFFNYGWAGILYWVSKKNNNMRSEFLDVNRHIDFVRHEEELVNQFPDSSTRAYKNITYTLGKDRTIWQYIMALGNKG